MNELEIEEADKIFNKILAEAKNDPNILCFLVGWFAGQGYN